MLSCRTTTTITCCSAVARCPRAEKEEAENKSSWTRRQSSRSAGTPRDPSIPGWTERSAAIRSNTPPLADMAAGHSPTQYRAPYQSVRPIDTEHDIALVSGRPPHQRGMERSIEWRHKRSVEPRVEGFLEDPSEWRALTPCPRSFCSRFSLFRSWACNSKQQIVVVFVRLRDEPCRATGAPGSADLSGPDPFVGQTPVCRFETPTRGIDEFFNRREWLVGRRQRLCPELAVFAKVRHMQQRFRTRSRAAGHSRRQ